MGFRNPLGGLPPSSITAELLAPGALDGQHIDHAIITNPEISGGTVENTEILRALLQAGPGASMHAWDFAVITAAVDPATSQISWAHELGDIPTAILVQEADSAAGVRVRPASITAAAVGFVPRDVAGDVVTGAVTFYVWACR